MLWQPKAKQNSTTVKMPPLVVGILGHTQRPKMTELRRCVKVEVAILGSRP